MGHTLYFEKNILNFPISVSVSPIGQDLSVQILGGCTPHLGSISAAHWENETVILKTILLPNHRDDVVSNRFATELAKCTHTNVSVLCGIHYDSPSKEELSQILDCTESLLQEVLNAISIE